MFLFFSMVLAAIAVGTALVTGSVVVRVVSLESVRAAVRLRGILLVVIPALVSASASVVVESVPPASASATPTPGAMELIASSGASEFVGGRLDIRFGGPESLERQADVGDLLDTVCYCVSLKQ